MKSRINVVDVMTREVLYIREHTALGETARRAPDDPQGRLPATQDDRVWRLATHRGSLRCFT